jgi:hypothetical protein
MRRLLRVAALGAITLAAAFAVYLALLAFPYPLFGYEATYQNISVYSDRPISAALPSVLSIAEDRLHKSPLNDPAMHHRVFICNDNWRFALLTNIDRNVGGLNHTWLNHNIVLRGANIDHNRLIGPRGNEVPGERTLSYYFAHEITHSLEVTYLGRYAYIMLPQWKKEGYADYIGKDGDFNFRAQLADFQHDAPEMDPHGSGLYRRYNLLVSYVMDIKGVSAQAMLTESFDQAALERELRAMK